MTSITPKIGGIIALIGIALKKHPTTAPWSELVEAIGIAIVSGTVRQNNVTSEQVGLTKPQQ